MLGLVDTAVVGQFGDAALLGGLAAGALIFDVVFTSFNFLRSGTTGLVAQAFGRGDALEEQAVFWRAVLIAIVAGIVLAALSPLVAKGGQWFMDAGPRVSEAMGVYIRIRLLAAPFSLINYAILGYVLGRGEGGLGLMLQLVLNSINIALCFLLGLKLGWGVAGVAWATVTGEFLAMLLGLAIVVRRFRAAPRLPRHRLLDMSAFLRMLSLNRDIMIRSFSLLAAFALFTRQGAQFGTVTLAANAVLMNFFLVAGYFLDGFATAAEQLAGRAVGARAERAFPASGTADPVLGFRAGWGRDPGATCWAVPIWLPLSRPRRTCAPSPISTALGGIHRAERRAGVPDGWCLHRCDLVTRHAQHDAAVVPGLRRRAADAGARLRQSRPVGGIAHLPAGARLQPACHFAAAGTYGF